MERWGNEQKKVVFNCLFGFFMHPSDIDSDVEAPPAGAIVIHTTNYTTFYTIVVVAIKCQNSGVGYVLGSGSRRREDRGIRISTPLESSEIDDLITSSTIVVANKRQNHGLG